MPSSPLTRISLLSFIQLSATLAQQCYYPDGSEAPHYTACDTTASATNCCADGEACLSSALCYMIYDMSINTGTCTDMTWQSPRCFQNCPKVDTQAAPNTLYRCSNNKWCCSAGGNTTSCCNDSGVHLFGSMLSTIINGSAFSAGYTMVPVSDVISTTTSSSKVSATETANGNSSCSAALPTGSMSGVPGGDAGASCPALADEMGEAKMRVGLGVGLGMGVPLLAALAGLGWLLRRERVCNRELKGRVDGVSSSDNGKGVGGGWNGYENGGHWPEMHGSDGAQEMAGMEGSPELDGVGGRRS